MYYKRLLGRNDISTFVHFVTIVYPARTSLGALSAPNRILVTICAFQYFFYQAIPDRFNIVTGLLYRYVPRYGMGISIWNNPFITVFYIETKLFKMPTSWVHTNVWLSDSVVFLKMNLIFITYNSVVLNTYGGFLNLSSIRILLFITHNTHTFTHTHAQTQIKLFTKSK